MSRFSNLENKIQALLSDLWKVMPSNVKKASQKDGAKRWWLQTLVGECLNWENWKTDDLGIQDILARHNAKFLARGASRMAFGIKHSGKEVVFKLCHSDDQGEEINICDNEVEMNAISDMCMQDENFDTLFLPMIGFFDHNRAGLVTVWPKVVTKLDSKDQKRHNKYTEYNRQRRWVSDTLVDDCHDNNVGYWKGFIWIIDVNYGSMCPERASEEHAKMRKDFADDHKKLKAVMKTAF